MQKKKLEAVSKATITSAKKSEVETQISAESLSIKTENLLCLAALEEQLIEENCFLDTINGILDDNTIKNNCECEKKTFSI
jgi:hypothetical protein